MVSMFLELFLCNVTCRSDQVVVRSVLIKIQVPLDYAFPKGTLATVPLIKISAEKNSPNGTYQGMLLMNPGTPSLFGQLI